jgi:hypothetical protein
VTVFNGGADSGDRMVKSMTNALNRWNKFLNSTRGKQDMASFFDRSESAVRALVVCARAADRRVRPVV